MDLEKQNIVTTRYALYGIGISVLSGSLLLLLVLWMLGIFGTAKDAEIMEQYKSNKAKSDKIIQSALTEAENSRKEAEVLRKQNEQLAAKLTERDKKRDEEVKQNDVRRKQENEKIAQQYADDVDRVANMPDSERASDICARLDRLAKDNPLLEQYRCINGVPNY